VLHCSTFTKGAGFADLARHGQQWEVKICKGRGLTINGSARINGENYIVVNYSKPSNLRRVWILWTAEDRFFTPRKRTPSTPNNPGRCRQCQHRDRFRCRSISPVPPRTIRLWSSPGGLNVLSPSATATARIASLGRGTYALMSIDAARNGRPEIHV
jgi:hypothetical protein